jgi:uncharacterized protein YbjT (DUF2867 family)
LGAQVVEADLADANRLMDAHRGVDYVVLQLPLGELSRMEPLVSNAIDAIKGNRIKGVVMKTGAGKPAIESDVPAFALNRMIEDKLRDSGVPFAIVRPTMYLENFLRPDMREAIRNRSTIIYSLPASRKIAWTCADDLARAALTLLENQVFEGDYSVSGTKAVDGENLARMFSGALERNIQFERLPLADFERNGDAMSGVAMARRLAAATIRFIEEHPEEVTGFLSRPFCPSPQLRGFEPTPIEAWIHQHEALFGPAE